MKKLKYILSFLMIVVLSSCEVLQQAAEMQALSKCEFRIFSAEDFTLSGVKIDNKSSFSDLSFMEGTRIMTDIATGKLPFSFRVNLQAKNPNNKMAAMNKLDWILYVQDTEISRGVIEERTEILPLGGVSNIPVKLDLDLFDLLSGESGNALKDFAFNLSADGDKASRFMIKLKPYIYVGDRLISYPGYIKVKQEFTAI